MELLILAFCPLASVSQKAQHSSNGRVNVCCALSVRCVRRLVCSNTQFQVEVLFQVGEPLGGGAFLEDLGH